MRLGAALATAAVATALACPPAHAALDFRPCPEAAGFACATLPVPLDRTGVLPGTVELRVAREEDPPVFARVPLVALTGGPGQPGVAYGPIWQASLEGIGARYRLVVLDPRGTGRSGRLVCPGLQAQALTDVTVRAPGTVEACAARLGPGRDAYATTAVVEDLEALRMALGAERIALAGVSYGSYVAVRYARAHPDRVERLILDSVVPQENVGLDLPATWPAIRSLLRTLCAGRACRGITRDAPGDLARTVARLRDRPLAAAVVDARGRPHAAAVDAAALYDLLLLTSLDDELRAELPALLEAAAAGDAAPLVRAAERSLAPWRFPATTQSWAVHAAALCADLPPAASVPALPADVVAPFDPAMASANGLRDLCSRWPTSSAAPAPAPGPLRDVPTLLLAGALDVLTPPVNAAVEAARAPRGQLVVVPEVGHSTLTGGNDCARRAVARFVRGQPTAAVCARAGRPLAGPALHPRYPRLLRDVAPAPGVPGRGGVAVAVALATLLDAEPGLEAGGRTVGGLRGGTLGVRVGRAGRSYTARGLVLVPGVRVDGTVREPLGRPAVTTLRVRGRGLVATGRIEAESRVTGTVDGRPFRGVLRG